MLKRVFALVGDHNHGLEYIRDGLNKALDGISLELEVTNRIEEFPWGALGNFDAVILAREGNVPLGENGGYNLWISKEQEFLLSKFVESGLGLLALHSAIASYPENGMYRKLLKGHFLSHPVEHPVISIKGVSFLHPIVQGITDFEIIDEQYFVDFDEADTTRLLDSFSKEYGRSVAGWAHGFGSGRVCCLTPGHTADVLNDSVFVKLIRNALLWIMKEI